MAYLVAMEAHSIPILKPCLLDSDFPLLVAIDLRPFILIT